MALTGLQIFKLLPNKNCKECGLPTCLAFAMKIAAKAVEPSSCPYLSEEAKTTLGKSQAPPIKQIILKGKKEEFKIGGELVLFRHDKTFYNPTLLAVEIDDSLPDGEFSQKVDQINNLIYERVGETIRFNAIALNYSSKNKETFQKKANLIEENIGLPLFLICNDKSTLSETIKSLNIKPIIYKLTESNFDELYPVIKENDLICVIGDSASLENLIKLSEKAKSAGLENIILKPPQNNLKDLLQNQIIIRGSAIKNNFEPLGCPTLTRTSNMASGGFPESISAIIAICKYSSIVIIKDFDLWMALPLLTLRQNIYTDPQKPLQVNSGLYKIGEPDETSPLLVTTNFSLTYFTVTGEVESAGTSAHLLVTDSEGMSVLTAWSAGKFTSNDIYKAVTNFKAEDKIRHNSIILPGYTAILKGETEEKLPDWNVIVGPSEASDWGSFYKNIWLNFSKEVKTNV